VHGLEPQLVEREPNALPHRLGNHALSSELALAEQVPDVRDCVAGVDVREPDETCGLPVATRQPQPVRLVPRRNRDHGRIDPPASPVAGQPLVRGRVGPASDHREIGGRKWVDRDDQAVAPVLAVAVAPRAAANRS